MAQCSHHWNKPGNWKKKIRFEQSGGDTKRLFGKVMRNTGVAARGRDGGVHPNSYGTKVPFGREHHQVRIKTKDRIDAEKSKEPDLGVTFNGMGLAVNDDGK